MLVGWTMALAGMAAAHAQQLSAVRCQNDRRVAATAVAHRAALAEVVAQLVAAGGVWTHPTVRGHALCSTLPAPLPTASFVAPAGSCMSLALALIVTLTLQLMCDSCRVVSL